MKKEKRKKEEKKEKKAEEDLANLTLEYIPMQIQLSLIEEVNMNHPPPPLPTKSMSVSSIK